MLRNVERAIAQSGTAGDNLRVSNVSAMLIGLTMKRDSLLREVIAAAESFHVRRMWERFTNSDCFAVRLPDSRDLLLATVMGDAGEEYGLTAFRGPGAVKGFAELNSGLAPSSDLIESIDMLGFSMDQFGELSPDAQASFRQAGLHPRHRDPVPAFIAKPPHRRPRWPIDSHDAYRSEPYPNIYIWYDDLLPQVFTKGREHNGN